MPVRSAVVPGVIPRLPGPRWAHRTLSIAICLSLILCIAIPRAQAVPADNSTFTSSQASRKAIVDRGLRFLASIQKNGSVGDSRQKTVTALFILACLSSGVTPSDPVYGAKLQAAGDWILKNSTNNFLGGEEEPNSDHAIAGLAVVEMIGMFPKEEANRPWYEAAQAVLEQSLKLQEDGANVEYTGGWRRNNKTRANDRELTAWYLMQLRAASLRGMRVPRANVERAVDFVLASQKFDPAHKEEFGGFSVDFQGLTVRHASGPGLATLSLFHGEPKHLEAGIDWFNHHPPRWYGPQFFDSNFFALRGLYHARNLDGAAAFLTQLGRVEKLIKERQDPDGSVPFPPGHGEPLTAMGRGYSTAMAILILNVDRGFLPVDQDDNTSLLGVGVK